MKITELYDIGCSELKKTMSVDGCKHISNRNYIWHVNERDWKIEKL